MTSQRELVAKFEKGKTSGQASGMFIDGDAIYSYGYHFTLALRLRRGGYIVNGDRYSVTTSQHQRLVFHLGPQVPFSALGAAGIRQDEIPALDIVDATSDRSEWVCKCGENHATKWGRYNAETREYAKCKDGYERHTLGGALIRHGRRYLLSAIDSETGVSRRLLYFICQLPRKADSIAEAYESLIPGPVKVARAFGAEIQRQGDFFFVRSALATRELSRNGYKPIVDSGWRGSWRIRSVAVRGYPLDDRHSHLATEMRERNGIVYVRGTVRHVPGEHRMVKLGRAWWAAFQNTAKASWAAAGNVD